MRKKLILQVLLTLFLLFSFSLKAQIVRVGIGGGLTSINSPTYYTDNISNGGFGLKDGYHLSLIAKFNIPLSPIIPAFFIDYHYLNSSGQSDSGSVSYTQKIFSIGAEGEWDFLPLPLIKPYLLVNISLNNFGELQKTISNQVYGQASYTRYGMGFGIGAVISIIPSMDLDLSAKYNFMNLIGKKSNEGKIDAFTLNLVLLF
jgi:hypothetical protein